MELIQCKVIKGKFGPQVVHEGEFYKIGSFSADRVKLGLEYEFILEEKEYAGKTVRWANLPRLPEGKENVDIDESVPPKESSNGLTPIKNPRSRKERNVPAQPKPRATKPIEFKNFERIAERIADALEGIESLLEAWIDSNDD